ncbi:YlbF family regulator [Paraclostridium bifermentans]|uniref:YlbF family regulator n=1 Tax=Paraclostridium bifermentans TaxID=1490 RepID=A0ABY8R5Y5_PARBF|nr:YlbF family regulator [Paraclostridium bifermentans]
MGVYESTTKLASDIKDSKEYKEFRKYMKVVRSNPNYELILNNYKKIEMDIRSKKLRGVKLDSKTLKISQDLKKQISANKDLKSYLEYEQKFTTMMDKINKILASAVYEDYK